MRIAYVTTYDSFDVRNWSGLGFYIREALEKQGNEIIAIGKLRRKKTITMCLKERFYSKVLKKQYIFREEPEILKSYARQVENRLSGQDYDLIFCPHTYPIAFLKTDKPIAIWLDSTFATIKDYYTSSAGIAKESMRKGNLTSQKAFDKANLILFSSDWALKEALKNYSISHDKVAYIPFGANIDCDRTKRDIEELVALKDYSKCKLLFVGVDWKRKGGDIAVETARILNRKGIETELHVVGCTPEGDVPAFVIQHGYISKGTSEGRAMIAQLFMDSHFMFLPTQAEMFGLVFAEASSWGLPSITTNTGGIPSAVRDGENGYTLDVNSSPGDYAFVIGELFSGQEKYQRLSVSSFSEYSKRLNWDASGRLVNQLLEQLLAGSTIHRK